MKHYILIPLMTIGQNTKVGTPWELPCDTLTSQTQMNICSGKKVKIADSVMHSLYTSILGSFESKCNDKALREDDSKKAYLSQLEKKLIIFKQSQINFENYLASNSNFVSESWRGGTIRPFMVNTYELRIIVERIKILREIQEEFHW